MIDVGAQFPEFSLLDQNGQMRALKDFAGKWLVLYFYPKDNTPGCTIEGRGFSAKLDEFHKLGAEVVGVSKDTSKSHVKFCESEDLKIILLSDPEKSLYASAQVGKKKMMGHEMYKRSTYIIDPKGKIAAAIEDVKPLGHEMECLELIRNLQK